MKKIILMLFIIVISGCSQQNIVKDNKIIVQNKTWIIKEKNISNSDKKKKEKMIMNSIFTETICDKYDVYSSKLGKIDGKIIYKDYLNRTWSIDFDTNKIKKIDKSYVITDTWVFYLKTKWTFLYLTWADPKTFKSLNNNCWIDKNNIFSFWEKRTNYFKKEKVDLKKIENIIIPIYWTNCFQENTQYIKYKNHIYTLGGRKLPIEIDNKSFEIMPKKKEVFNFLKEDLLFKNKNNYFIYKLYGSINQNPGLEKLSPQLIKFLF